MEDVAPKLLEAIRKDFTELLDGAKIEKMNYMAAGFYADKVGEALAEAFRRNISPESLPDGKMYWNIADRVVRPMLEDDHKLVADAAQEVQQILNKEAGIGLKAQRAPLDQDKVAGILNKVSAAEDYADVAWVLDEPVKTFSRSVVDDTLRRNVEFQGKAGLRPRIIRTAESKCCKWCSALDGVYSYPDVPKDVYRRHERCRCDVEYDPGGARRRQNVHTKRWKFSEENDNIIVQSGAKSGKPIFSSFESGKESAHANLYYKEIRHRKPYSDAKRIAKNIDGFSVEEIEEILV